MTHWVDDFLASYDEAEAKPVLDPALPRADTVDETIPAQREIVIDKRTGRPRQAGSTHPDGAFIMQFRDRAERSLYVFAKGVLGRTYLTTRLHKPLCDGLQVCPPHRKGRLLPREHGKTSIVAHALPMHILIQSPENNSYFPGEDGADQRIYLCGETEQRATDAIRVIQAAFETNDILRALWPHRVWDNPRRDAKKWNDREMIVPRKQEYPDPSIRGIGVGGAVTGAHPTCIAEGTLVYTSNGLMRIEDVHTGARVLTRAGHHREVLATMRRHAPRLLRLDMWGQPDPVRCTPDHRLLCYRDGAVQWVQAADLRLWDLLALPIPEGRTRAVSRTNPRINAIVNNPECWRLLGYWLAEGAASKGNAVRLTFGVHERDTLAADAARIARDHLGCDASVRTNHKTSVVSFSDADFKAVTRKFGTHAANKHIPPFAIATKRHFRVEMVRGYFRGDGHKRPSGWGATSISQSLLAGMQLVLASLDIPSVVRRGAGPRIVKFPDGTYETKQAYVLHATHPLMDLLMGTEARWPLRPCRATIIPGYILFPVRAVGEEPGGWVYDLQVAKDESFVISGACAHNCLIKDDLVTLEAANSPVVMDTAIQWHVASRALINNPKSLEFIIGTRWAVNDLYEYIMRNDPTVEWEVRSIVEDGELIYPEAFTFEKVAELQKQFGVLFPLLYMNSAADPELTDFDMEMIRTFEIIGDRVEFREDERDLALAERMKAPGSVAPAVPVGATLNAATWQAIYTPGSGGLRFRS